MSADGEADAPGVSDEQLGSVDPELVQERRRSLTLAREIRILEDRLAEARSEVLRREQAAQAARFRVVAETEARLAAESRVAELTESLQAVYATRTFRYTRGLRKLYGSALRRR